MAGKILARIAAIVFVSVAITAMAVEWAREDRAPESAPIPVAPVPPADLLREGQRQCQRMGEAALRNENCLSIWAETRDRFLKMSGGN